MEKKEEKKEEVKKELSVEARLCMLAEGFGRPLIISIYVGSDRKLHLVSGEIYNPQRHSGVADNLEEGDEAGVVITPNALEEVGEWKRNLG